MVRFNAAPKDLHSLHLLCRTQHMLGKHIIISDWQKVKQFVHMQCNENDT